MEGHMGKSLLFGLGAGVAGAGVTAVGASLEITTPDAIWPVLAVCAVVGALVHEAKQSITDMIDNRLGTLKNRVEKIRRDVGDIHGLVRLGPYTQDLPLPMGGGWALTGDSAALLAREVLARKPETILELGSGVSTLILGQILKRNGRGLEDGREMSNGRFGVAFPMVRHRRRRLHPHPKTIISTCINEAGTLPEHPKQH